MADSHPFVICDREIGREQPPFIIAEMSGNHNQSLDRALALVEAAAKSGADALKFFPASSIGPKTFNAINEILPKNTKCFAVGGINSSNMKEWIDFNISGFGIGTNIYNPKMSLYEIKNRVEDFAKMYQAISRNKLIKISF